MTSQLKEQASIVSQTEAERDQLKSELESEIQYLLDDKDRAQARHMVSSVSGPPYGPKIRGEGPSNYVLRNWCKLFIR